MTKCPFVKIFSQRLPAGSGLPSVDPETSCQTPSSLHDDCAESGAASKTATARRDTARMGASNGGWGEALPNAVACAISADAGPHRRLACSLCCAATGRERKRSARRGHGGLPPRVSSWHYPKRLGAKPSRSLTPRRERPCRSGLSSRARILATRLLAAPPRRLLPARSPTPAGGAD